MIALRQLTDQNNDAQIAMDIINDAKKHLKDQGIDQWQNGYPDETAIQRDIASGKGYFVVEGESILVSVH